LRRVGGGSVSGGKKIQSYTTRGKKRIAVGVFAQPSTAAEKSQGGGRPKVHFKEENGERRNTTGDYVLG